MMKKIISTTIAISLLSAVTTFAQTPVSGTVTDNRDGKVYKTIDFGGKIWMVENLKFETRNSWCYKSTDQNCDKYGRMYSWSSAMNGQSKEKGQGVCMKGWHVPSLDEWNLIISQYKKSKDLIQGGASGFNIVFGGCRFANNTFDFENKAATYWTSTSDSSNNEFATSIYGYADQKNAPLKSYQTVKTYGLYLRCVKN